MNSCENCGCRVYHGDCVNCDEEAFIDEQRELTNMEEVYAVSDRPVTFASILDKPKEESK